MRVQRLSRPPRAHRACSAAQLPRRSLTRVPLPACYFGSIDRRPERILLTTAKTFLAVCEYVPRYRPCLTGRSGQRARTSLARSPPSMSRWRRPRRIRLPPSARSRCDNCPKRPPPRVATTSAPAPRRATWCAHASRPATPRKRERKHETEGAPFGLLAIAIPRSAPRALAGQSQPHRRGAVRAGHVPERELRRDVQGPCVAA